MSILLFNLINTLKLDNLSNRWFVSFRTDLKAACLNDDTFLTSGLQTISQMPKLSRDTWTDMNLHVFRLGLHRAIQVHLSFDLQ